VRSIAVKDQVVEHVGLGFDRSAAVVLAHERDDPVGDLSQQPAADERPEHGIVGLVVAHRPPGVALTGGAHWSEWSVVCAAAPEAGARLNVNAF
jgi:hypothetical protein